ncbi:conjugative transposon protein TraN [Siphonobacter sp. SORGH_AS_1065]|uniref:conjugative transposon protein TraN n=1 Tax=Siphonobacter sp. SORGH_AS_1065 TaxID=3041795 RepID=UPI00277EFD6D|nr:conjugative transposon protein TraN [Siphonobacter sp. SORGH_AS_1065]MDQ1090470.1 conjugative transposon TraN protein [Siphonobacter sp. SORGH_AS_1065]
MKTFYWLALISIITATPVLSQKLIATGGIKSVKKTPVKATNSGVTKIVPIKKASTLPDTIIPEASTVDVTLAPPTNPFIFPIAKKSVRGVYPIQASYTKTVHIIFPRKVSYIDLGSSGLIADKADESENILRIKANEKGFTETTLAVITDEGRFYSFLVNYNEHPDILSLAMTGQVELDEEMIKKYGIQGAGAARPVDLATLGGLEISSEDLEAMATKVLKKKGFIRDVGTNKLKMEFKLDGIYVKQKIMFITIEIENNSEIDYDVDFFKFFLKDRDVTKRMASQEIEVVPQTRFPMPKQSVSIPHRTSTKVCFPFQLITFGEDKLLECQMYESKGGRHLRFEFGNQTILRAKGL